MVGTYKEFIMAFTITGQLVVDETTGTQNTSAGGSDITGNDVAFGLGAVATSVLEFNALLSLAVTQTVVQTNVSVSNGTTALPLGSRLITNLPANVSDLAFTQADGSAFTGQAAMFGAGATDFMRTTDGSKIFLYSFVGDAPNLDTENNVVFGRKGVWDPTANGGLGDYVASATGDIVFAAYLQPTSNTPDDLSTLLVDESALASDTGATGAKVWLVEYEPIQHPAQGSDAAAYDDQLNLYNLYVTVNQFSSFSLEGAPSGQNLFLMFGDGTPGVDKNGDPADEVSIVVTATNAVNQSGPDQDPTHTGDDLSIVTGGTVNTGQGGGGTTLGHTNQMIDAGEALAFTFVTGATPDVTVPNLDQNEADLESNIKFTALYNSTGASFTVVQLQQDKAATLTISASNADFAPAGAYIDELLLFDDGFVNINYVKVSIQEKVGNAIVPVLDQNGDPVFNEFGPGDSGIADPDTGVTVTFNADGTVTLTGVEALDVIEYHTGDAGGALSHSRVVIANSAVNPGNQSHIDAAFDIGGFALRSSVTETEQLSVLGFQDDGPTADIADGTGSVTIDETAGNDGDDDTSGATLLGGVALSTVFSTTNVPNPGEDGTDLPQYALSDAPLVSTTGSSFGQDDEGGTQVLLLEVTGGDGSSSDLFTTAGDEIFLSKEGDLIVGRYDADGDLDVDGDDDAAFAIALGQDGKVATVQYVSLTHNSAGDGTVPPGSYDEQVDLDGKVDVKVLVTDGDGDTSEDTVAIGNDINFEDDGPTASANDTVLLDDDALTDGNPGGTGDDADSANVSGTLGHAFGQDGEGATVAYLTTGAPAGFTYETSGTSLLVKQGTTTVLTLTMVSATGAYTVVQNNPILHAAGLDENNQEFTINYRVTDGDGDTADGTLGINVDDDTPVVIAKSNLVYANDSNPPPNGDPGGTGIFAYAIGADTRTGTTYSATNSDFVSPITLTGTVGVDPDGAGPLTNALTDTSVTWFSESDTEAVFNVDFTYLSNPTSGATTTINDAKLTFDKEVGTYNLKVPEIESFSILQTSTPGNTLQGYLVDSATTQSSNPPVSVMTLASDFFVQFEGFGVLNGTPQTFAYDATTGLFSNDRRYVTISSGSIGAASDTLQSDEVIDLDFFTENPMGFVNSSVTRATSKAVFVEMEQVGPGAGKDLLVVLKLVDDVTGDTINRTFIVGNSTGNDDIINADLPAYGFVAEKQNGIVVFESNDYNFGTETYSIQGMQVVTSTQNTSGTGYQLNGLIDDPTTVAIEGATTNSQIAFGGDTTEGNNEPIKIINLGFVASTTPDAHLIFNVAVKDADGDATASQTLDVTIVGGDGVTASADADTFVIGDTDVDGLLSMVMTVIDGGFVTGIDKLDFSVAGSGTNYTENLVAAANLAEFTTAADDALNGTMTYYFGVVAGNGYLAMDGDANGITSIVELVGVTNMEAADIM
jgi:hypothetical protein